MKRTVALTIAFILLLSLCVFAEGTVNVNLDGKILEFDQYPVILDGRTLVPMRKIFEELGGTVTWDDSSKTAVSVSGSLNVRIQAENDIMLINGNEKKLDVPAKLINGRTLVPARAVAEAFGCSVDWDSVNRVVIIKTDNYSKKEASFKKYVSPKGYGIAYTEGENYTLQTGETMLENIDFLFLDNLSGASINVVSIANKGGLARADQSNLKEMLEDALGVTFTSYQKAYYNYIPAVEYTYKLNDMNMTQIVYFTGSYVYTVTMALDKSASDVLKSDFEYIAHSLGV